MKHLSTALSAVLLTGVLAGCGGGSDDTAAQNPGRELKGTFRLDPGRCEGDTVTGTYFRMIQRGGTVEKGKYFKNPDSTCPDQSISVQVPGAERGLRTGAFQPVGATPFDGQGNATASRITQPGSFTAIRFGLSTQQKDPQSGRRVQPPQVFERDGVLSGQISAFTASWNNLYFNQGSPKPDGSTPGETTPVTGTYDEKTGAYELSWASQVQGGPFDGFAGFWHLQGTFVPE